MWLGVGVLVTDNPERVGVMEGVIEIVIVGVIVGVTDIILESVGVIVSVGVGVTKTALAEGVILTVGV